MFHLFMATPEKVLYNDVVYSIEVPGTIGYMEILTNHAPIISTLKNGKVEVSDKDKNKFSWNVSGGFLEVSNNKAKLLVDSAEKTG
jgi:F-type H+-transporting ATPase subunit epsilon